MNRFQELEWKLIYLELFILHRKKTDLFDVNIVSYPDL